VVIFPDSAVVPAGHGGLVADPLPTTSSAPNLNQLNDLDQQYREYLHGPVSPHPQATQWCWLEQPQTGEMNLVPCPYPSDPVPPPDSHPGYPPGD
jgi:hypothetical protein